MRESEYIANLHMGNAMTDDTKPKRGRKPKRIEEYSVDAEQAAREVQDEYRVRRMSSDDAEFISDMGLDQLWSER